MRRRRCIANVSQRSAIGRSSPIISMSPCTGSRKTRSFTRKSYPSVYCRGLRHAEGFAGGTPVLRDEEAVETGVAATAFTGRGLLASAACGVFGRAAIADLELRATEVTGDTSVAHAVIAKLPDELRRAQQVFGETGGLHGAGLFTRTGELLCVREDVGRHNAVDKVAGWALATQTRPDVLVLSGRAGYA